MNIQQRIEKLRASMLNNAFDAYIVSGSDPHGSEIPPKHWHTREWLSGFTGSAGTLVVTMHKVGLWTDSRYWIQADRELDSLEIELFREGECGTPEISQWLIRELGSDSSVAFDGQTLSVYDAEKWSRNFEFHHITLDGSKDLLNTIWEDRPPLPDAPLVELREEYTGESRETRIRRLRLKLKETGTDTLITTALDSIAWLLNIRGADVPFSPLVLAYLIVTPKIITCYTNGNRVPKKLLSSLKESGVEVLPYEDFLRGVALLPSESCVLFDKNTLSYSVASHLPAGIEKRKGFNPIAQMQSIKNSVELGHIRSAMEKDGVALVRFFVDLEKRLSQGESIGEVQAAELLEQQRSAMPGYLGSSFATISALGSHAAICHYKARLEEQAYLTSQASLYLVDSGAQWENGTTDITRTIALREPTAEEKYDYTSVLKAHIALSQARFPMGTASYQLDAMTRAVLWEQGIHYGHGTGHGVGFRLNVHEGNYALNSAPVKVAIEPGMLLSNEPGLYRENHYGIRIENLIVCQKDIKNEFGQFLSFETLTLAPYDSSLIDLELLSDKEILWIDEYHKRVWEKLNPYLNLPEKEWLENATAAFLK